MQGRKHLVIVPPNPSPPLPAFVYAGKFGSESGSALADEMCEVLSGRFLSSRRYLQKRETYDTLWAVSRGGHKEKRDEAFLGCGGGGVPYSSQHSEIFFFGRARLGYDNCFYPLSLV